MNLGLWNPPTRFYCNCHYACKRCGLNWTHTTNWNTRPTQMIKEHKKLQIFNKILLIFFSSATMPSLNISHLTPYREILQAVALSFFSCTTFLHIYSAGHKMRMNDSSWPQALLYPSALPQQPAALLENILPWTGNWQSVCASGCPSSVSLHCYGCRLFQKDHRWSPA